MGKSRPPKQRDPRPLSQILAAAQEATGETIDPGLASRVELNMRVGRLRKKVNALAVVCARRDLQRGSVEPKYYPASQLRIYDLIRISGVGVPVVRTS